MKIDLPNFSRAKIMVIGDVMIDRYWYGEVYRISQEAPVPIVKINTVEDRPGGAANVAMNIASLGANLYLIGLVGKDEAAYALKKALSSINIKCKLIPVPIYKTIIKLRVFSRSQQLIRIDFGENFENIDPNSLNKYINQNLNDIGVLVLSDYAKGTLVNIQEIIALARKANIPVLIDPKGNNFERYRGATLLKPNLSEFEAIVGKCQNEEEIITRGIKLISDFDLSALLVTRAENGMILIQLNKKPLNMPIQAKKISDVTGAGDTVIGVLATALAAGNSLEEACYFANMAAGIVVSKLGVETVSPIELENAVKNVL